jgi:FtsP/CotA-like multicopper oxidase with cupredoxin domain
MKYSNPFHFRKLLAFLFAFVLFTQCNSQRQKSGEENNQNKEAFQTDIEIELTAKQAEKQLLPGEMTKVYTYESKLIKGEEKNLEKMPDTYLGPIIHVKPGQKIRVRFKNQLPGRKQHNPAP